MLKYNTLLQLMLFCRRENKRDEVLYVDLFFTLRNHPEWQKVCGLAPQDPMVIALVKESGWGVEQEFEKMLLSL